ncbi:MAG: hypothetical protein ACPG7F_22455 [Aggregatilineales bacterium]
MKTLMTVLILLALAACSPPAEPLPTVAPTDDNPPAVMPTTEEDTGETEVEATPTRESAELPSDNTEAVAGNAQSAGGRITFTLPVSNESISLILPDGWSQDSDRVQNDADPFQRFSITVLRFDSFADMTLDEVADEMEDSPVTELITQDGREMVLARTGSSFEALYVRDSDGDLFALEVADIVDDPDVLEDIGKVIAASIEVN